MALMDDVILVESEESDNSILEIEVPKKPTPPIIHIEDEEIFLNIRQENELNVMAKDFIVKDKALSVIPNREERLNNPSHWTNDMIKFYDDDWGNEEHFTVEKIQEKMDKTSSLWQISRKDSLHMHSSFRKSNMKCWNCNQRGHHFTACPDPPHVTKCHMCGTEGHEEYTCPNSKCLNCGNHSKEYVTCCYKCRNQMNERCSRCMLFGHNFINCPDHWRLFHLTTGSTSVIIPNQDVHKSNQDIWCCNCGKKGHYQIQCLKRKDCGVFKDTLPFVVSYQKAFAENFHRNKTNGPTKKKQRRYQSQNEKIFEKFLQINSKHKTIGKNKTNKKNKLKRLKRFRKRRRKNETQFPAF